MSRRPGEPSLPGDLAGRDRKGVAECCCSARRGSFALLALLAWLVVWFSGWSGASVAVADPPSVPDSHSVSDSHSLAEGGSENRVVARVEEDGVGFYEGSRRIVFYQRTPRDLEGKFRRAHYFHPVLDLDGRPLTEDFPADHRHHRGIFWAWHQVLIDGRPAGDAWATKDFEWDVQEVTVRQRDPATCLLRSRAVWKSPAIRDQREQPLPLVEDTVLVAVGATEAERRVMDFEIRLRALQPEVRIGGSDDDKGYGGFSVRTRLSATTRFLGAAGNVEPARTAVQAGPWIDIVEGGHGVLVLAHPSLPQSPPDWILRQQRSMQNPVFPGREPIGLPGDQPLVLRYRLILHRSNVDREQLGQWYQQYAEAPLPNWDALFSDSR